MPQIMENSARKNDDFEFVAATNSEYNAASLSRSFSETDYQCCICLELMVLPTTLNCGHSLCRPCLSDLYLSCRDYTCPQCRQPWKGHPKINVTLRTTMQKIFGSKIDQREGQIKQDIALQKKLKQFDEILFKNDDSLSLQAKGKGFWAGVLVALLIVSICWLAWQWRIYDNHLLVTKPITKWSTDDVQQWLRDLGSWTNEKLVPQFAEKHVDGHMLMVIDEVSLALSFNVTEVLQIRSFMQYLMIIKESGVKPPANLWEYKALHQGRVLFLLLGIKDYPRLSVVFMYIFSYEDLFLPFIHQTSPVLNLAPVDINLYLYEFPAPTISQWIEMIIQLVFIPYWLYIKFAWCWKDDHFWLSRMLIINFVTSTFLQVNALIKNVQLRGVRGISSIFHYRLMLVYCGVALVWPLVPGIVCDVAFYWFFYTHMFTDIERIIRNFRRR